MTEVEWLACSNPGPMLESLRGKASDRKLRLFACACVRRIWDQVGEQFRPVVEAAELFADGGLAVADLETWYEGAFGMTGENPGPDMDATMCCCPDYADGATGAATQASRGAAAAVADVVLRAGMERAGESGEFEEVVEAVEAARHVEWQAQTDLIRDIFGNPFHPATIDPAWRTSTVVALATQMYESRDFGAMPILADALQDAGCDSEDVLGHCRGPGPHVRGCWVVDLVLGKE